MTNPIKVLVVDDSAIARGVIAEILRPHGDLTVVGFCKDGTEVVSAIERLNPDIITLDVEMPLLSGPSLLKHVLSKFSIPVIMVSGMTQEGAQITLDCLALGAMDFVLKPGVPPYTRSMTEYAEELVSKVKAVGRSKRPSVVSKPEEASAPSTSSAPTSVQPVSALTSTHGASSRASHDGQTVTVIGASTGGPSAVAELITKVQTSLSPMVIAIHMPKPFTSLYADRLARLHQKLRVKLAEHGEILRVDTAYLAPGDTHLSLERISAEHVQCVLSKPAPGDIYKPSIDRLFSSAAQAYGANTVACVLTGMGNDGSHGAREIFETGGYVITQDEASSAIYGMPKVVYENRHAHQQVSLSDLPSALHQAIKQRLTSCNNAKTV
jgi:two-component system, chemotaxis family, protein-glutamate methylesterase/glutaminase